MILASHRVVPQADIYLIDFPIWIQKPSSNRSHSSDSQRLFFFVPVHSS